MAPASVIDLGLEQGSTKQKVYMIDHLHPRAVELASNLFDLVQPDEEECKNWRQNATAILMKSSSITADDIAQAPRLKAIAKQGVGIDRIDQEACNARGIKIINTPGANARSVAEMVLALAMAVARNIRTITFRQSMGEAVSKENVVGISLYQKTIGIIGMGNIGKAVAQIFQGAFDANVIAFDPYMPSDAWADIRHKRVVNLEDLIRNVDILTIHVPLTPQTRDLISYSDFKKMRRNLILINAARGAIVNEEDLTRALEEHLIFGAGLDCHEQEPPTLEKYERLWNIDLNVVSTPHLGAATVDAQIASAVAAVNNLNSHFKSIQGL